MKKKKSLIKKGLTFKKRAKKKFDYRAKKFWHKNGRSAYPGQKAITEQKKNRENPISRRKKERKQNLDPRVDDL